MRTPYGLDLNESCPACRYRRSGFFCQLSPAELNDFDALKSVIPYPAEALLFLEQQKTKGIYVLCEGEVKLSFSSSEGKRLLLRIARPGEVLGLLSALSGSPYEATAETLRPCQVAFVPSNVFQKFLRRHPNVFRLIADQLGLALQECVRTTMRDWLGCFRVGKGCPLSADVVCRERST